MYDPTEGFTIHWDYCLGLPKRTAFAQQVFGVYCSGQTIYPPKFNEPKDCEVESSETNREIIGVSHNIFDIPPNTNDLLIIELQIPRGQDKKGNPIIESYGWT